MLVVEIEREAGGFRRDQRVVDGDALLTLDDGQVGKVRPPHLIDTRNHFIEARFHQQLRDAPEAGVDGIGRGRVVLDEAGELREVPDDPATLVLDDAVVGQSRDQAALGILEVQLVRPGE